MRQKNKQEKAKYSVVYKLLIMVRNTTYTLYVLRILLKGWSSLRGW